MSRLAIVLFAVPTLVTANTQKPPAPPAKKDAKAPALKVDPKTDPAEAAALAQVLRDLAKKHIPDPLSKSSQKWGNQKAVTVVHRYREGLRVWSEPVQEMRNDGLWRRTTLRIPNPDKLALEVIELTHPTPGTIQAAVAVVADRVDLHFEHQLWRNGLRLYGGETRAHCQGGILLKAEVTTKTEFKKGSFFPDVSLKLRVTDADIFYDKIVVDHTAGLDGDAAKAVGDVVIEAIKAIKPDLENDLREKAEAAVVKAVGVREFKVALDKLLQVKPKK